MNNPNSAFLGTGWSFPPQFSLNNRQPVMLSNEDDIHSSLQILLATRVGERIMQPDYGCNLDKMLFEPITVSLQSEIKDMVSTAIYFFEPRITPLDVKLSVNANDGWLYVNVTYMVNATNSRYNMVYPFYNMTGGAATGVNPLIQS